MDFTDDRWAQLRSAYGKPYDVRPALRRFAAKDSAVWNELWEELHHQGDVGEAAYAAIPAIVSIYAEQAQPDWNVYALAATIEEARHNNANPVLPAWLVSNYERGWAQLEARRRGQI